MSTYETHTGSPSFSSDFAGLNFCPAKVAGRQPFQSDIFHFFRTKEKYFFFWGGGGGGGGGGEGVETLCYNRVDRELSIKLLLSP